MVILTAKVSKGKLAAIVLLILFVVVLLAVLLKNADEPTPGADGEQTVSASEVRTNEDRVAYLAQFGWEVSAEPVQTQEVRIPTDPSDVFERYNDLQIAQGFDLHDYAGKTVRRYVYEIENYPGGDGQYYATLLICKGAVIGGDVCAAEKGGVMHGFAMPEASKTAA